MECSKCGCEDLSRVGRVSLWGKAWQRWECNHCGHRFDQAPEERPEEMVTVIYPVMICPFCESTKTRVTSSPRPIRYHICEDCARTWRSEERRECRRI